MALSQTSSLVQCACFCGLIDSICPSSAYNTIGFLAVHEVNFYSSDSDQPHVVTITEGQAAAINCGSYTNTPASDLTWAVRFGTLFEPVTLGNEGATVGLNQSMYLLDPSTDMDGDIFSCSLANTLTGSLTTGYVQVNVEGT